MAEKEVKTEELEQHDFYDDDYIDEQEDVLAPIIGSFLINFSRLEHEVNISLSDTISHSSHHVGYIIVKDLDFSEKVSILKDLITLHLSATGSKNLKRFGVLHKRLVECMEFRNKIAHANWNTLDEEGFVRVKISAGKNSGFVTLKKERLTPDVIKEGIERMSNLEDELYEFLENEQLA